MFQSVKLSILIPVFSLSACGAGQTSAPAPEAVTPESDKNYTTNSVIMGKIAALTEPVIGCADSNDYQLG